MGVDESREQGQIRQLDHVGARWHGDLRCRPNGHDPITPHEHDRPALQLRVDAVENPGWPQQDAAGRGLRRLRRLGMSERGDGERGQSGSPQRDVQGGCVQGAHGIGIRGEFFPGYYRPRTEPPRATVPCPDAPRQSGEAVVISAGAGCGTSVTPPETMKAITSALLASRCSTADAGKT